VINVKVTAAISGSAQVCALLEQSSINFAMSASESITSKIQQLMRLTLPQATLVGPVK